MKFYDYEVEDLSFHQTAGQAGGLPHAIEVVLERRSREGWRLLSMTGTGHILVFERESTKVEVKRVGHGAFDQDNNLNKELMVEGWFLHSADSTGVTFTRKKL